MNQFSNQIDLPYKTSELVPKPGRGHYNSLLQSGAPIKQIGLSCRGKAQTEGEIWFWGANGVTYPTKLSQSPHRSLLFPCLTAKCWGSQCHFREFWREDLQENGPSNFYDLAPVFPDWGWLGWNSEVSDWLTIFVSESRLFLPAVWQTINLEMRFWDKEEWLYSESRQTKEMAD